MDRDRLVKALQSDFEAYKVLKEFSIEQAKFCMYQGTAYTTLQELSKWFEIKNKAIYDDIAKGVIPSLSAIQPVENYGFFKLFGYEKVEPILIATGVEKPRLLVSAANTNGFWLLSYRAVLMVCVLSSRTQKSRDIKNNFGIEGKIYPLLRELAAPQQKPEPKPSIDVQPLLSLLDSPVAIHSVISKLESKIADLQEQVSKNEQTISRLSLLADMD